MLSIPKEADCESSTGLSVSSVQACFFFLSFLFGVTRSLRMPALQACLTGWPNAQPYGMD